jgi:hypothetical protein
MAKKKETDIKRDAALQALFNSGTLGEAAEVAGISRRTLYNYIHNQKDPSFVIAYRDMKREQLRESADKIQAAADKATDYITGLLDDQEAAPHRLNLPQPLNCLNLRRHTETLRRR